MNKAKIDITPTKRGFVMSRVACVVCGEPPFGNEYCCGHEQSTVGILKAIEAQQLIQMSNHPTSEPWIKASTEIHRLAEMLMGKKPVEAR